MKCFILKTQADPSKEPYERHVSSLTAGAEHRTRELAGQRAVEASDCGPGSSPAVVLHCVRFGIECKHLLWAFTFLCQFGFHCLNLALAWGGLGPVLCAARGNLPVERRVLRRWPGSGSASSQKSCLRLT